MHYSVVKETVGNKYLKVANIIQYRSLSLFMPELHFVCFLSCEHYVLALLQNNVSFLEKACVIPEI